MGYALPKALYMYLVTSQHRHFQLYHSFMRGSHLLPSQLPGEHTGHEAASRCSEPIWNAHIPPIALIAGTHFTYPGRDGRLSQPVECSTAGPSHISHYGAMPVGWSPIHVLTGLMIASLQ